MHITSPGGTDLRFRAGDRPANLQDGDASAARTAQGKVLVDHEIELPAGVVRVAPLEDTVEGVIAFPPSQWDGRPVEGLKLRFAKGRVVEITAASGKDAVEAEMQKAGDAGRAFREIGLGFNPLLAVPERTPWIPYYGYGAGVVRLSLGDNTELGGAVAARPATGLRPLEFLHRPHGDRRQHHLGPERQASGMSGRHLDRRSRALERRSDGVTWRAGGESGSVVGVLSLVAAAALAQRRFRRASASARPHPADSQRRPTTVSSPSSA